MPRLIWAAREVRGRGRSQTASFRYTRAGERNTGAEFAVGLHRGDFLENASAGRRRGLAGLGEDFFFFFFKDPRRGRRRAQGEEIAESSRGPASGQ